MKSTQSKQRERSKAANRHAARLNSLLPVIQSCAGCGACCMEQGSPPGYLLLLVRGQEAWPDPEDIERFKSLPVQAMAILEDYSKELLRDPPRTGHDRPCCWLDQTTMQCRFYEHRPNICRDLDIGSEGCRAWRDEYNVDVEQLKADR